MRKVARDQGGLDECAFRGHFAGPKAAGAEKLSLRGEQARASTRLLLVAGVVGLALGAAFSGWWFDALWNAGWPRLGAGLAFSVSSFWLLRGAWRAGRVSGAREL